MCWRRLCVGSGRLLSGGPRTHPRLGRQGSADEHGEEVWARRVGEGLEARLEEAAADVEADRRVAELLEVDRGRSQQAGSRRLGSRSTCFSRGPASHRCLRDRLRALALAAISSSRLSCRSVSFFCSARQEKSEKKFPVLLPVFRAAFTTHFSANSAQRGQRTCKVGHLLLHVQVYVLQLCCELETRFPRGFSTCQHALLLCD